jgi:hypothetical protein
MRLSPQTPLALLRSASAIRVVCDAYRPPLA